jgi:hypothetical protein
VLSPERVREELWKVLGGDASPTRALELYRRSGTLLEIAPEIAAVAGDGEEGSPTWGATLAVLDRIPRTRTALRFAVLLGDVGVPPVRPDDPSLPADPGPATSPLRLRGMIRSAALLTRLRHSNARIAEISGLVGAGPDLPPAGAEGGAIRRWLARVDPIRVPDLIRWAAARSRAGGIQGGATPSEVARSARRIRAELASGVPLAVGDLALGGRELIGLGLKPGPHFGRILERLLDRVLADPGANRPEFLKEWALELASEDEGE